MSYFYTLHLSDKISQSYIFSISIIKIICNVKNCFQTINQYDLYLNHYFSEVVD